MSLRALSVHLVPTPSHILDGHYVNGDDGTAGIPLTWDSIPDFLQKQVGTPFSVNLITLYLHQPLDLSATASIHSGSLSGTGWSLAPNGLLSYDGVGTGRVTISVRATRFGVTSDSGQFTVESIPLIVSADNQAPTIPTGLTLISRTTSSLTVNADVPSDMPTSTIPATGIKEIRWFKNGVFDGVTSYAAGLLQRLTKLDVSSGPARKWFGGHWTAISNTQKNTAGGLPNPTHTWNTGPVAAPTSAVLMRWQWAGLESGVSGGTYTLSGIKSALAQCRVRGVALFAMIEVRSFGGDAVTFTTNMEGKTTGTLTSAPPDGDGQYSFTFWYLNAAGTSRVVLAEKNPCTVTGKVVTWTGALASPPGGLHCNAAVANAYSANPMPSYLRAYSEGYMAGIADLSGNPTGGWQGWRWNLANVSPAFQRLCAAIGSADSGDPVGTTIDAHPYFGGLSTQETSVGSPDDPGFNTTNFTNALIAELDSIGNGCPTSRPLCFYNFGISAAQIATVVGHGWQYGLIMAGPDLVMNKGGLISNVYPVYTAYHNGTASPEQGGPGATGCSIQPAEWAGSSPADKRSLSDLYNYAVGNTSFPDDNGGNPLHLDVIIPDWHTVANWNGEQFNSDVCTPTTKGATAAMAAHPAPFGTYDPGSGMTTGSVTQTGLQYVVTSYGLGIGVATDQWTAARNSVNGDVTVIVKFAGLTSGVDTSNASMGVCLRENETPSARAVYAVATATKLRTRSRGTAGGAVTNLVDTNGQGFGTTQWVAITRVGNLFSFYYSNDSLNWTAVGTQTLAMAPTIYLHFFAANFAGTGSVTATFQQVNIQQLVKGANYTISGLSPGTSYNITAIARDLANNDSAASAPLVVSTG